ncbi:(3,5-dihydroxyphenyl)acetyl-CoA 1,2-dioxygenase DpgC [Nocardia mexicana]|uniref:3,5-dihydroxyphenylacetyl-CoA monooxygenase n=1 Tax=Nocardia mexicana TaxID=279262 RepID=A0A370HBI5_9NOCA|nr:(3,5-dihydroxyphenyl)acetyl-CoA 1,2-dioxygenase DpgC [Nocardia mexicana]RDI53434.1 3,5-dihydroxyphenylacetyl-CoA monooxygenase [Nocardia mexicana]
MSTAILPGAIGDLSRDGAELRRAAAEHAELLLELGAVDDRDSAAAERAAAAHRSLRELRRRFLQRHVAAVYGAATADYRDPLRLAELASAATDLFPGLLPSAEQLALDAGQPQSAKEGWEIDQGLFFAAVFADPVAGNHLLDAMRAPTRRALELADEFAATGTVVLRAATVTRVDTTATVTITNTHCLNAEDNQHVADLETAVDLVLLDPHSRVGVLRGGVMDHPRYRGRRVFSAGINLAHLHEGRISFVDFILGRETGYIAKILRGLATGEVMPVTKPWVAAVDSFAIGGGAQLLLVFDRVIAAADAYFSLPAAQEGIVPGAANLRLGRATDHRLSRDVILWGRRIHATEPDARLVFDTVVETQEMDGEIDRAARQLAAEAVVANKHMLVAAEEPQDVFRCYMAEFARQQALRFYGSDVLAKVSRFSSGVGR